MSTQRRQRTFKYPKKITTREIVTMTKMIEKQFIFIAGTIGAGKSSILNVLPRRFPNQKVVVIKEYIDYDPQGEFHLNAFLSKRIGGFEFQRYVVESYFKQFQQQEGDLYIFERHPLESLLFAAKCCSLDEIEKLYNFISNMCFEFGIPLPRECEFVRIENNGIAESSVDAVADQIKVKKQTRRSVFVHLDVDGKVQVQRLMKRARSSDIEYLMENGREYLRRVNLHYAALPIFRYDIKPATFYVFYRYEAGAPIPFTTYEQNPQKNNDEY